jgi:hypothetical protein
MLDGKFDFLGFPSLFKSGVGGVIPLGYRSMEGVYADDFDRDRERE